MAQTRFMIALAAAIAIAAAMTTEAATNHVIGGSTGWTIPSSASFYSQWASARTFAVGDTLLFNFTTGFHNVMEVTKSSYDSCSASKKIGSTLAAAPATITLTKPGNHYYICGVAGHCSIGQKLAINVARKASSPSPAAAPSAGAPVAAPPVSSPSAAPVPAAGAPAVSSPSPAPGPAAGAPAPAATTVSSPGPAPSASAPAATTPAASSSVPAAAPTADSPASPLAPSSSSGSGASAGPTSSNTADNQNPTAVAGPADGGPTPSSATSLLLSSGYSRSAAIAAALSATAAFFL